MRLGKMFVCPFFLDDFYAISTGAAMLIRQPYLNKLLMILKVLEGRFVIQFGGETMVAKPQSYQATSQLSNEDNDNISSSRSVLGIALGIVFGVLAVVVIIGIGIVVGKCC